MATTKKTTPSDPPLVSFSVTNPITYLKSWWKRIIGNEGVEVKIKVRPLTTLLIVFILFSGTFSLGALTALVHNIPVLREVLPLPTDAPVVDLWRDEAYSGILRKIADGKYYLQTTDAKAINLTIPANVNLEKYVGKRIFASGRYNIVSGFLEVTDATDLEVLPQQAQTVATIAPTATPTVTNKPISTPVPPDATPSIAQPTL
jgi:hypothetical protein